MCPLLFLCTSIYIDLLTSMGRCDQKKLRLDYCLLPTQSAAVCWLAQEQMIDPVQLLLWTELAFLSIDLLRPMQQVMTSCLEIFTLAIAGRLLTSASHGNASILYIYKIKKTLLSKSTQGNIYPRWICKSKNTLSWHQVLQYLTYLTRYLFLVGFKWMMDDYNFT